MASAERILIVGGGIGGLAIARAQGASECSTRTGVRVTRLAERDERVEVALSDGSHAEYDLVIGADGLRSSVRTLAMASAAPTYAGQVVWRSVIDSRVRGVDSLMVVLGTACCSPATPPPPAGVAHMKLRVWRAESAAASGGGKPRRTRRRWRPSSMSFCSSSTAW
jgi:hypothetical protein